jgi:putative CocE/NonD family hydrolase
MRLRGLAAALAACVVPLCLALPAAAGAWTPEAPSYGVGVENNLAVTMSDGTVLRADVYTPTDLATGQPAPGPFPVILTQTPYGKSSANVAGAQLGGLAGGSTYLVQRGYIDVVADVRGTGGSQGQWGLFDPVQGTDGATLVRWAATLPHANGTVGLLGASYLGIDQFATAVDAGRGSPVKAMFPIITGDDLYRDTAFTGGFPDVEFDGIYLGLTAGLNLLEPAAEGNQDALVAATQHIADLQSFDASLLAGVEAGGDQAYDQSYWQARNPAGDIQQIVDDGIPAFLVGGWYDLFQRGEPLNYAAFQNALGHRPLLGPMSAIAPVSARYQLLQGPWYHVTAGMGLDYRGLDLGGLELAWFDRWLRGVDTGITDTSTPMHLYDLATGRYEEASRYPLDQATPTRYYLGDNGSLSTGAPGPASAPDTLVFTGSEIPCTVSTEQWAAGAGVLALSLFGLTDPCAAHAGLSQIGPGTQNYTTAPVRRPVTLAGPIGATVYLSANTPDTEIVVQVSDVAPNGDVTPLTSGLLDGSFRAVDPARTWAAPDGLPLLPYHPYTKASQQPVTPGSVTRYDVEVFPTFDTLEPGHALRITVATSDFPHALPSVAQLPGLLGGVYQLHHDVAYPSSVELPLADPAAFGAAPATLAAGPTVGCLSGRTVLIHVRGLGRRRIRAARVTIAGRRVRARIVGRNGVLVSLRRLPRGVYTVRVRVTLAGGAHLVTTRRYRTCHAHAVRVLGTSATA